MGSKIDRADAQEWLESLRLVGEGWYRQVALALRAGAHKALGMKPREFAQAIGQRMIDPRPAIIDLHGDGHSVTTIANTLGMGNASVHNVLVEEGLVDAELQVTGGQHWKRSASDGGGETPRSASDGGGETPQSVRVDAGTSEKLQEHKAAKKKALDAIPEAEKKAAEASIEDFVSEMRSAFNSAAGVYLKPLLADVANEMNRVANNDLEIPDYEEIVAGSLKVNHDLWVYGAKRGYDVSRIGEMFDLWTGGDHEEA